MEVQELIFAVHPGMTDHLRTTQQMVPGDKSTKMTSNVTSEGMMFLAFEVCRS